MADFSIRMIVESAIATAAAARSGIPHRRSRPFRGWLRLPLCCSDVTRILIWPFWM